MDEYKHNADDKEVQAFINHPFFDFAEIQAQSNLFSEYDNNIANFIKTRNVKKIGFIMQSGVLNSIAIEDSVC